MTKKKLYKKTETEIETYNQIGKKNKKNFLK